MNKENWILVEEEMPPAGQRVIVTCGKKDSWEAYWSAKAWRRDIGGVKMPDLEMVYGKVLAWMPMPAGTLDTAQARGTQGGL